MSLGLTSREQLINDNLTNVLTYKLVSESKLKPVDHFQMSTDSKSFDFVKSLDAGMGVGRVCLKVYIYCLSDVFLC